MTDHTFTINTYSVNGLLDTSYRTNFWYMKGKLMYTIKSIVVRKYHQSKLIDEKEFTLGKDGSKTLSNETIKQYDATGNTTTEINIMDSNMFSKTINEYNDKMQVIKTINILQKRSNDTNDYILDSVIAHLNDKKQFQYDTSINTYKYDSNSNQIRVINSDTKEAVQEVTINQYFNNVQTFSYSLNSQGDTTGKLSFRHEGKLVRQISERKELNSVDTSWLDNNRIVKSVGFDGRKRYKSITTYNSKGDEIENISYKQQ